MKCRNSLLSLGSLALVALSHAACAADADPEVACAALAELSTPAFRVDLAEWNRAGPVPTGPGGATTELPAHCRFQVVLDPRTSDLEGLSYGVGFELRLPLEWNGRFLFQGGGGMNGSLGAAIGNVNGAPSALARGFAVVSTDGGHRGGSPIDSRFAVDQQARLDFAYGAVTRTTYEAKAVVERYYGRRPEHSYFMGCSTGGREAMLVAQRLPLEYDGVVAGNAAFNFSRLVANQLWSLQTVTRHAPRDASGKPQTSQLFSDAQLKAVADGVLASCDALDGLADGMINDFQACRFDPVQLQCSSTGAPGPEQCLSHTQVTALQELVGGAQDSRGNSLYGSTVYDTGIATAAWRGMHFGNGDNPPGNAGLGRDTMANYILTPMQPDLDPLAFDFDRDMPRTLETAAINDAVSTMHSTFAGQGGKLIVYHGLSDQGMFAGPILDWYNRITPRSDRGPQDWARLFMIPGMTHCGGGQSTDQFDMLTAIQQWVEQGKAPDLVTATGRAFPGVERPLCPYPQVARYDGGDPAQAASFSCR
jgi:feruloyl esterase